MPYMELFEKVIDCKLTQEELKAFLSLPETEYDSDNSFDKYFSLDKVKYALGLYYSKKINDEYLSDWAGAYCRIIMATDWNSDEDITLKVNTEYEIADWLEVVSFFGEGKSRRKDIRYLNKFYDSLNTLYGIRQNSDDWIAYYKTDSSYTIPLDKAVVLYINDKNKSYFITQGFLDDKIKQSEYYLGENDFDLKAKELKKSKYKKLKNSY